MTPPRPEVASRALKQFHTFIAAADNRGVVLIRVLEAKGSTPRDRDAFMLVSANGIYGTIGGGRLEMDAMDQALAVLDGNKITELELVLGPESGQCCGGRMRVGFERIAKTETGPIEALIKEQTSQDPEVWVFGGGHVGRALAQCLINLPVNVHLVESRAAELADIADGITCHLAAMPESMVDQISPGAAVIVLTHDHGLDFLIVQAALDRDDLTLVGMIGSKTKRATFESQYRKSGGDPARLTRLTCPIGTKIADKRPSVIAVTVAAQIMAALSDTQAQN